MNNGELSDTERVLFDNLPGPPVKGRIKTTNVCIIEWLPSYDQQTGGQLFNWIQERRPNWAQYYTCSCKLDVLSSIEKATNLAIKHNLSPILHLEAHGDNKGLWGPIGHGSEELLSWDELTKPLQRLNLVTRCNLTVWVAACMGFSGILALTKGPRAPALVLIGPSEPIFSSRLLSATKEFYRRWIDQKSEFNEIARSASREAGGIPLNWEPFVVLAYDTFAEQLILMMRRDQQNEAINRYRKLLLEKNLVSATEIENILSNYSPTLIAKIIQMQWNTMFMIDVYPENAERFGVDWNRIAEMIKF